MSRAYVFTYNNPTISKDEFGKLLQDWACKYIVMGFEHAPTTGTPHYQGYVYWKSAKTIDQIVRKFKGIHFEVARGTANDSLEYCSKEDKNFYEFGEMPRQGKRNDINLVKQILIEGGKMTDVVDATASFQAIKHAEVYLKYKEKPRNFKPYVEWLWGPTGSGKTKSAHERCETEPWISGKNLKWWEGYDRHECVIIDDFRKDFCTFHELLRILDRYEYRIEVKGGSRQLVAKHMIITSCHSPHEVYETREDLNQLLRRIDKIEYISYSSDNYTETETQTDVGEVIMVSPTNPFKYV